MPAPSSRPSRRLEWLRFGWAVVIVALGIAALAALLAGAHRAATVLGLVLVAVSAGLLAVVLSQR